MNTLSDLCNQIRAQKERVAEIQAALCACPALAPQNGGNGELARANLICEWLNKAAIDYVRKDSPDSRAANGIRPNIIARVEGKTSKTLWLFAHMDVVPAGDPDAWESDPWQLRKDGDFIFGRGVEDNQQALTSMLILAESLRKLEIVPEIGLGLVFMADEECGSEHGMKFLLASNDHTFKADDFYIVPDGGSQEGNEIEIAEKAQLWLKFVVNGKQVHASMPGKGKNAFVGASQLVIVCQSLYRFFPQQNALFDPPFSTFVPTRHEENVAAINILPGKDIFYMDCRLVPEVQPTSVLEQVQALANEVAQQTGLEIDVETIAEQPATATSANTSIMKKLTAAIFEVYGVHARPVGIGGATVASFLRRADLPAVVWSRIEGCCHQPNERSSIASTLGDAVVFARILMHGESA